MVEMKVKHIAIEEGSKNPVMILTDLEDRRFLPIWIGGFEAHAIAQELEGVASQRPMTHDLLKNLLEQFNAKVQRIVVNDLQNETFFARIIIVRDGKEIEIDARPSDSVAMAVRFKAPIFVAEAVIQKAAYADKDKMEKDRKDFSQFVEQLKPEMFSVGGQTEPREPQE